MPRRIRNDTHFQTIVTNAKIRYATEVQKNVAQGLYEVLDTMYVPAVRKTKAISEDTGQENKALCF